MSTHNNSEKDRDLDDVPLREHVFDGIQEYDNKLPNWWLMTFYGAIVFSVAYWFVYHISEAGAMPEEKLVARQARAAAHAAQAGESNFSNGRLIDMSLESDLVASGQTAFTSNCTACHGADASGGIGPDLSDGDWIHGKEPTQILHVIRDGVAAKGMPAWKGVLGDTRTAEITAFLISLNPSGFQETAATDAGKEEAAADGGN